VNQRTHPVQTAPAFVGPAKTEDGYGVCLTARQTADLEDEGYSPVAYYNDPRLGRLLYCTDKLVLKLDDAGTWREFPRAAALRRGGDYDASRALDDWERDEVAGLVRIEAK
jgi:hypothetical protein